MKFKQNIAAVLPGTAAFLCFLMLSFSLIGCSNSVSQTNAPVETEATITETAEIPVQETEAPNVNAETEPVTITGSGKEATYTAERPLIVEIDPGHGGKKTGAENFHYHMVEKDLNLQIAFAMKEALEEYDHVIVCMTREDDTHVELADRVKKAGEDHADVLISLHNNGVGSICNYYNGCNVLTARGAYREELSLITQELGCYVLNELKALGSEDQGLMYRVIDDGETYENGELCDYYHIVRESLKNGFPGIIIEHGFLDNDNDFELLYATDEKIKLLGEADARAVAAYYGLSKDGIVSQKLSGYTEKIVYITSDDYHDNKEFYETWFR